MKSFDEQFKSVFIDENGECPYPVEHALNVAERRVDGFRHSNSKSFLNEMLELPKSTHTGISAENLTVYEDEISLKGE